MPLLAYRGLTYISTLVLAVLIQGWAFPCSLAVTEGIAVAYLFQRLVICLSSARRSWIPEVGKRKETVVAARTNPTRPLGL